MIENNKNLEEAEWRQKILDSLKENSEKQKIIAEEFAAQQKATKKIEEGLEEETQKKARKKEWKTLLVTSIIIISLLIFFSIDTSVKYDDDNVLSEKETLICINQSSQEDEKKCKDKSVKITAFVVSQTDDIFTLNINQMPESESFFNRQPNFEVIKNKKDTYGEYKILVKGVFDNGHSCGYDSYGGSKYCAVINGKEILKVELNEGENKKLEYLKSRRTPEAQITSAREEGAKMLEAVDVLIQNDVTERRKALEGAAVEHRRINTSGAIMTDGYTMQDGRLIICTTKVLSSGPAIMDCNGEP